jgi:hypothetical protein
VGDALAGALANQPEAVAGIVQHIDGLGLRAALEDLVGPLPEPGRRVAAWHPAEAPTDWGGLLMLLHVLHSDSDDHDDGDDHDHQSLHALGMAVLQPLADAPLDPRDPALLAFAGLSPDHEPPPRPARPPTTDAIHHALSARGLTAAQVCRRAAVIVTDPGWIEARFSLDDVDVDIRRVGLDLDPGWLPWLGVVVRFSYA